jgi:hypothetical protein
MNPGEQPPEVEITFHNESSETLLVTPIGENLYRMEETSVLGEVRYHDIIETELQDDGSLRFLRVATPSELKTTSWLISRALAESQSLSLWLDRVMASGGNWERIFGGYLIVHLPPAVYDVLIREFDSLFDQFRRSNPP